MGNCANMIPLRKIDAVKARMWVEEQDLGGVSKKNVQFEGVELVRLKEVVRGLQEELCSCYNGCDRAGEQCQNCDRVDKWFGELSNSLIRGDSVGTTNGGEGDGKDSASNPISQVPVRENDGIGTKDTVTFPPSLCKFGHPSSQKRHKRVKP